MQSGQRVELHEPKTESTFHPLQLNPKRNQKLFHIENGQALKQVDQKNCTVSIPGDTQHPAGQCPEQPALVYPTLSRGLD